jgi:hypothetical protein
MAIPHSLKSERETLDTCPEESLHPVQSCGKLVGSLKSITSLKDIRYDNEMGITFLMDKLTKLT